MATAFNFKPVATLKAQSAIDSKETFTFQGVTTATTTPTNAATQINKILGLVGKSATTDKMTRTITEEAVDDE